MTHSGLPNIDGIKIKARRMGNHCVYVKCKKCGEEYCVRCEVTCNCDRNDKVEIKLYGLDSLSKRRYNLCKTISKLRIKVTPIPTIMLSHNL
tara:strand:- start:99 stop:374 length:276 start_codon:yes stop_codon:yes gene_type:complete